MGLMLVFGLCLGLSLWLSVGKGEDEGKGLL